MWNKSYIIYYILTPDGSDIAHVTQMDFVHFSSQCYNETGKLWLRGHNTFAFRSRSLESPVRFNSQDRFWTGMLTLCALHAQTIHWNLLFITCIGKLPYILKTEMVICSLRCSIYESCRCNRPWRPKGLWDDGAPTFHWWSAHRWRLGCQPYAPVDRPLPPRKIHGTNLKSYVLIFVRGGVCPRATVRPEGLCKLKKVQ
jgi:hypothetical protein